MNKIRELREASGKQQKDIAIDLGVSQPTVSDWENGRKIPSAKSTSKLADYFGVSIDYLLGRDEKEPPALVIESGHSKDAIEFAKAHPELTTEEWEELERYAMLLIAAKKAKEDKK